MRLLAFLESIEKDLRNLDIGTNQGQFTRLVDYKRASARLRIDERNCVVVNHYQMSSGRYCLRVSLANDGSEVFAKSIYPDSDGFSWPSASRGLAADLVVALSQSALDEHAPLSAAVNA